MICQFYIYSFKNNNYIAESHAVTCIWMTVTLKIPDPHQYICIFSAISRYLDLQKRPK